MKYWIALSNHLGEDESGARGRIREKKWWRKGGKPTDGDKVIIYQPASTKTATRQMKIIEERFKSTFIGHFTVGTIIDDKWLNIGGPKLWDNVVKWNEIKAELDCNKGATTFWNKRWIEINKHDYDLIMQTAGVEKPEL